MKSTLTQHAGTTLLPMVSGVEARSVAPTCMSLQGTAVSTAARVRSVFDGDALAVDAAPPPRGAPV